MKKLLVRLVMASMLFIAMFGCTQKEEQTEDGFTFGVALRRYDDTFLTELRNAMERYAEGKYTVDFVDSQAQQSIQNDRVDIFITKGYDCIAVDLQERSAAQSIIEKCKAADVPIIFYNTEPYEGDLDTYEKAYYVGARAEQSGQISGQIMVDYWKANPQTDRNNDGIMQYVMLQGDPGHNDAILRTEHSIKTVEENGIKVELLAQDSAYWDRVKGQDKMQAFLGAHSGIEAVFCNNDDMALGAIEALKAAGYNTGDDTKYIPVVGVDATEAAKLELEAGTLLGTVMNDPALRGQAILNLCEVLSKNEQPTSENISADIEGKYVWIDYSALI